MVMAVGGKVTWWAVTALVFFVGLGAILLIALYTSGLRGPLMYEIPDGYRGWAIVRYEEPSCPPLQQRGIDIAIRLGADGMACTSDLLPLGGRYTEYRYVRADGSWTRLSTDPPWEGGQIVGNAYVTQEKYERFFVGTEADLQSGAYPHPTRGPRR